MVNPQLRDLMGGIIGVQKVVSMFRVHCLAYRHKVRKPNN